MAAFSGIQGKVKISGAPDVCIAEVKSWSADITWANEDTTSFDCADTRGKWGQNALTMKSITGTVEANLNVGATGQATILNKFFGSDGSVDLELYPYDGTVYLTVPALLTGASISSTAGGIVTVTFNFVQSGTTPPTFEDGIA